MLMKKRFILFLMAALTGAAKVSAQEPYIALNEDEKTLTFYYDDEKAARGGEGLEVLVDGGYEKKDMVATAVFDASFAQYHGLTSMAYWFHFFPKLTAVKGTENVNTENVTSMTSLFQGSNKLESVDLSTWNTSNVETMESLFWGCNKLKSVNVSTWNTSKATNIMGFFAQCESLESVDVAGWDVRKAISFNFMFDGCKKLKEIDISGWNPESMENNNSFAMFSSCLELTTIYVGDNWNPELFTEGWHMFYGSEKLVGGQGTTYQMGESDGIYARIDGGAEAPGYLTYKKYTGIRSTKATARADEAVYSLSGQRLKAPRKGVNIIAGRKVVVN